MKQMQNNEEKAELGKRLAVIRQNKYDPGSPCMECHQTACPAYCRRKHAFEAERGRYGE